MTAPLVDRSPDRAADRPTDLRLASVHLRMGSFQLARAELEAMAGHGLLDDAGTLDLAEARWRTGDLAGAGEAAAAHIALGRPSAIGLVIAAEAQLALGRPTEAHRLAAEAIDRSDTDLDAIFAGRPRSDLWPPDPFDPARVAETLPPPVRGGRRGLSSDATTGSAAGRPASLPDGRTELDAAGEAVAAGDLDRAALHLALVLRAAPALAPVVLEAMRDLTGPSIELVRGDAYRLVGREIEADLAYRSVADATARQRLEPPQRPETS